MLQRMKASWKRTISGLLAVVMMIGMLPTAAFAVEETSPYAPTGDFELNVAGATAWNGGDEPLTVYKTESDSTKVTTIPTATPFALLEDNGGNQYWVTTADEFQAATGITDQQKEQMFHCNSSNWSKGWTDGDYTSMWGTDPQPGNQYRQRS